MTLHELCQPIQMILSDVDGVLTDGGVVYDNQGIEIKKFHIRDGLGIKLWKKAGFKFGVVTARTSHIVKVRTAELGIDIVRQGFEDKVPTVLELLKQFNVQPHQLAYIGDDLTDLPVIRLAGLGVAVADAASEVRASANHVTTHGGGKGAVREIVETILKQKGLWEDLIQKYY